MKIASLFFQAVLPLVVIGFLVYFLSGYDLRPRKKEIPFREFKIKKCDEETLGQLFSYFILETSIVGKILGINPFDQPAVEQVKKITKINLN